MFIDIDKCPATNKVKLTMSSSQSKISRHAREHKYRIHDEIE